MRIAAILCLTVQVLAFCPYAGATDYFVRTDGSDAAAGTSWATAVQTIGAAIAKSVATDTVTVSNGTYEIPATIDIGIGITVQSANGYSNTFVDGLDVNGRRIFNITDANAVLAGFTVTGGQWTWAGYGAGVHITAGTLKDCRVVDNYCGYGGGIWQEGGLITNCIIEANRAYYQGGGLYANAGIVSGCTFISNRATRSNGTTLGGGALITGTSAIERSLFRGNSTRSSGGGVYVTAGGAVLENCVLRDNTATGYSSLGRGGGIYLVNGLVMHCTVANNSALQDDGNGVYMTGGAISNSIIAVNGSTLYDKDARNLVKTGGTVTYSCVVPSVDGTNNVTSDPNFISPGNNDFHLLPGSPCLDAGTNVTGISVDFDGNQRSRDGDADGSAAPDMGAHEEDIVANRPFLCNFNTPTNEAFGSLTVVFAAYACGSNTNLTWYDWDFGNGVTTNGANLRVVTNSYGGGAFDVSLTVSNTAPAVTNITKTGYVVVAPATNYVATNGSHMTPFATWATAATNFKDAVDVAWDDGVDFTTVLVSNGTFVVSEQINILKGITIRGVNGAANSIITANDVNGWRVFDINASNAVLEDITVTGGDWYSGGFGAGIHLTAGTVRGCIVEDNHSGYGAGFWLQGGLVTNCLIQNNRSYINGGGAYCSGGTIVDCTFISNKCYRSNGTTFGGGAYLLGTGKILDSVFIGNTTRRRGGGVWMSAGLLRNSLIIASSATGHSEEGLGGGLWIQGGVAESCTISGNTDYSKTGEGLYMTGGTVSNVISYFNGDNDTEVTGGTVAYSCTDPVQSGTGNTGADPQFVNQSGDDFRLLVGSPCIDTGTNHAWMSTAVDLAGSNRITSAIVDMGCYEAPLASSGPLQCNFSVPTNTAFASLTADFTAFVSGTFTNITWYEWDFGDGVITNGSNLDTISHDYSGGYFDVSLTVSNDQNDTTNIVKTSYIRVSPVTAYVATNGLSVVPYATWATAATNIDDAISVALDDGVNSTLVLVSNGTYEIPATIDIGIGITVQSVNGYSNTIVDGLDVNGRRIFNVTHSNAVLAGFTVTGGQWTWSGYGSGVHISAGTLKDCLVLDNYCGYGGGVWQEGGIVTNCIIKDNRAYQNGGGLYSTAGTVVDCTFISNKCTRSNGTTYGGGARLGGTGRILRSRFWGNTTRSGGGGVYMTGTTLLRNCLVTDNDATGYSSSGVGGGIYFTGGLVENCTVSDNTTFSDTGDGIWMNGGVVSNTIVYFNESTAFEKTGGTVVHSCSSPLVAGTGNISTDPEFADRLNGDYELVAGSGCIDAGTNATWMVSGTDLNHTNRIQSSIVDIGCYETKDPFTGPLTCNFAAPTNTAFVSLDAVFTASAAGGETNVVYYWWDFGDSTTDEGATKRVVTNSYSPGRYTVSLTVSNDNLEIAGKTKIYYVNVAPAIAYVATNGSHTLPYDSLAKAASNVQAAVDVAWAAAGTNRTTVLIMNGTYEWATQIEVFKDITVRSINGADSVILTAPADNRIIHIDSSNAVLDGVTVQGAYVAVVGAGIRLADGTVQNCVIRDNNAYPSSGGGISLVGGVLKDSSIIGNTAYVWGGGVYMTGGRVENCLITSNRCNRINGITYGGGIYVQGAASIVSQCLILGNTTRSGGGGVYLSSGIVRSSTIIRNECTGYLGSGIGGGMNAPGGYVTNSIIYYNTALSANEISGLGTFKNCCSPGVTHGVNGNITTDPSFVDPGSGYGLSHTNGDYHLADDSPCRDVGINESWMITEGDFDGLKRLRGTVDIGAYEWQPDAGTIFIIR